jgi:heptosyltransferase-2
MIEHLLVRAPNWVGDLVMATPVIEAALADRRFARVTIAVRAHLAGVLAGGPATGRLLEIHERKGEVAALRAARADAVLLLSNSFSAAWRSFRARIPLRAGAALGARRFLLTQRVVPPARDGRRVAIPTAHLLRDVAGLFGILPASLHPRLHLDDAVRADARAALARAGLGADEPYVLCAPGAAFGAAKLWPPRHHAATLDALHARHGWRGVVTGAPGEEATIAAVVEACRHPVVSLASEQRDLVRLKAWVEGTRLLLVGDSGPRWYAAAFDVPCVTILGPNSPELTASSLEWCEVVRRTDLECSPCLERVCPLGHHRCLVELPPARALEAAERLLARPRS